MSGMNREMEIWKEVKNKMTCDKKETRYDGMANVLFFISHCHSSKSEERLSSLNDWHAQ